MLIAQITTDVIEQISPFKQTDGFPESSYRHEFHKVNALQFFSYVLFPNIREITRPVFILFFIFFLFEFLSLCLGNQNQGYGALRDGCDQRLLTQHKPKRNPIQSQPTRPIGMKIRILEICHEY